MPSQTKAKIITRFAPSPTGFLHIGNARAALVNYIFARQSQGKFILRIEDTDRERSKKEFEQDILSSLDWLKLDFDELYRQSERLAIYKKYEDQLLKEGKAYEKGGAVYFSVKAQISNVKMVEFSDLIRGKIATPVEVIDDFVIVKSDSTPLFLFTNVIDDFEMGVTHVFRGEDHISNTPRQILLAQALGISFPQYGHLPVVLAPDRSKLSKRHGAVAVSEFKSQGYLPEAVLNTMLLLGWNPGNDQENFKLSDLIKVFSLERVQRGGAIFNIQKLDAFNRHYINLTPNEELFELLKPFVERLEHVPVEQALKVISIIKGRLSKLTEFESLSSFMFDDIHVSPKMLVFKKSKKDKTKKGLEAAEKYLSDMPDKDWQTKKIQLILEHAVSRYKLENGDLFWPVRVALSGHESSPPPVELAWALGKQKTLKRLGRAIALL